MDIYEGCIHSVRDYYYKKRTDEKEKFEKITIRLSNKEILTLYRDIITNILYLSEDNIQGIDFNTKYLTNIKKLNNRNVNNND